MKVCESGNVRRPCKIAMLVDILVPRTLPSSLFSLLSSPHGLRWYQPYTLRKKLDSSPLMPL
ncbi:unnamed protein product, partial [Sphenostylis stenocarpa]